MAERIYTDLELGRKGEGQSLKIFGSGGDTNAGSIEIKAPATDFEAVEYVMPATHVEKGFMQNNGQGTLSWKKDYYRHNQGTASAQWTITHNMKKNPSVTVTDSAGTRVIGQVTYINENTLIIEFSAGFSGFAELN